MAVSLFSGCYFLSVAGQMCNEKGTISGRYLYLGMWSHVIKDYITYSVKNNNKCDKYQPYCDWKGECQSLGTNGAHCGNGRAPCSRDSSCLAGICVNPSRIERYFTCENNKTCPSWYCTEDTKKCVPESYNCLSDHDCRLSNEGTTCDREPGMWKWTCKE